MGFGISLEELNNHDENKKRILNYQVTKPEIGQNRLRNARKKPIKINSNVKNLEGGYRRKHNPPNQRRAYIIAESAESISLIKVVSLTIYINALLYTFAAFLSIDWILFF